MNLLKNSLLVLLTLGFLYLGGEVICRFWVKPQMQIVQNDKEDSSPGKKKQITTRRFPDGLYHYTPEGGLRLTPNANILLKNHYLSRRDIFLSTNSLGFRSPEFDLPKNGEYRILVLGDSITLGDFVLGSETYTSRIENYLKTGHEEIRIINAGVGSADIRNQYQILLDSGIKSHPDIVLIGLYLNDGELSSNILVKPLPGILAKSYLANLFNRHGQLAWYRWKHRNELASAGSEWLEKFEKERKISRKDWRKDREGFDYLISKNYRDWGAAWNPETWSTIEGYLKKIKELGDKNNFQLVVALFPVRHQVEADYLYNTPQEYFSSLMEELQIPSLDLLPILRRAWSQNGIGDLYYDKCHLTPQGNDIVGKSLAVFLSDGVLPKDTARLK